MKNVERQQSLSPILQKDCQQFMLISKINNNKNFFVRNNVKMDKIFIHFIIFFCFLSAVSCQNNTTLPVYFSGGASDFPINQPFEVQYDSPVLILLNWGGAHMHFYVKNQDTGAIICGSGGMFPHYGLSVMCNLAAGNYTFHSADGYIASSWYVSIDYYVACPVSNCLSCIDPSNCAVCKDHYGLTSTNSCQICVSNCTNCPNNTCISCDDTFILINKKCQPCFRYVHQCLDCQNLYQCKICLGEFVLVSNSTCECPVGLWEVTNICIDMVGCTSAVVQNSVKICKFCDISKNFQVSTIYKNCTCMSGFQYSSLLKECEEICGDGRIFKAQCDDGNIQDFDGCSSNCTLQTGFSCKINNAKTSCLYIKDLSLSLSYIMKDPQSNSANLFFQFQNLDQISIKRIIQLTFNPVVSANITDFMNITGLSISQDSSGRIFLVVKVSYNKTLEGNYLKLEFGFQNTSFISKNYSLSFYCRGKNFPLIISLYYGQFSTMSTFTFAYGIAVYIIILFMIFSDKFIGVETLVTIQLIYFSQLLISDVDNWPQAFTIFAPLKIVTGYNNLFAFDESQSNFFNQFYIKYRFLDFRQTFLVNNMTNLSILFLLTLVYSVIFVVKNARTAQFQQKIKDSKTKNSKVFQKFKQQIKYSRISYHLLFNFCMIISLQMLASIIVQIFNLDRKSSSQSISKNNEIYQIFNKLSIVFGFGIIIVFCANNFMNTMLNQYQSRQDKFQFAQHEKKYVRTFILYVFATGIGIFCFNCSKIVSKYPISIIILLLALIYLIYLIVYRPYKYSLLIHQLGIFLNQITFIIALIVINLINYGSQLNSFQIPENYLLVYSYLMCVFSTILILIAMIRFYYQFRYGDQIKKNMIVQQQKRKEQYLNEKTRKLQQKMKIQDQKGLKQNSKDVLKSKNKYLYQNQVKETQKIDYIMWLQSKKHLNKHQKQHMFYRKYKQKSQNYVKNQQGKYYLIDQKKKKQGHQQKEQKQKLIQKGQMFESPQQKIRNKKNQKIKGKSAQDKRELEQIKEHLRVSFTQSKQKKGSSKSQNKNLFSKNKNIKAKILSPQKLVNFPKQENERINQIETNNSKHPEDYNGSQKTKNKKKKQEEKGYSKSKKKQH